MFSVLFSFLLVSLVTYAATTISADINTGGTLTVSGNATLGDDATDLIKSIGSFYASSTLQATGAARFYSTARIDGATVLNSVSYTWPSSDGSASTYLQTNGAGTLAWATVSSGANSDWLKQTNFGVLNLTASTTIPYWAKDAIYASSTLQVQGLTTLVNATTSLLTVSNGAWFTNGNIGISTTSPWGLLSINPNGISGPSFVIGSSTVTNFVITNSGNIGIGTTSPGSLFSLNNIANFTTATSTFYGNGLNLANGCFAINGTCVGAGGGSGTINSGTTGQFSYYAGSGTTLTATSSLFIHSNQNIGIGTTTPNWLLQAAGTRPFFTLSDMGAATDQKHWFLSSQGGNFYVGTSSDAYATSTHLTIDTLSTSALTMLGSDAGRFNKGQYNTFIGYQTGYSNPTASTNAADYNSVLGYQALYSNTTGRENSAMGFQALYSNTTGIENSAVGLQALYSNTTGYSNSAIGHKALYSNTTGIENSAVGLQALNSNTSGHYNTAMGFFSGKANTTGTFNTYLGFGAGSSSVSTLNYTTAIGVGAQVNRSNSLILGGTGTYAVNVGIGTTTPTVTFQAATSTANATTTIEVGKANQNKGSCLKMYDTAGTVAYCTITGTTFSCSATSCE